MRTHPLLLGALASLLLFGCSLERNPDEVEPPPPDDDDDSTPVDPDDDDSVFDDDDDSVIDDDDDVAPDIIIIDVSPLPGESEFFGGADLFVLFDRTPDFAVLSLFDEAGQLVPAIQLDANGGRLVTLDPVDDLAPLSEFVLAIDWGTSSDAPLDIDFTTGPYGQPIVDPAALEDLTFVVDLATGTFVEPPGVGAIIQSQVSELRMLIAATADSAFEAADQPGVHVRVAAASSAGPAVTQEPCATTPLVTAGEDGEVGTADDRAAALTDPTIVLGPTDLELSLALLDTAAPVPFTDAVLGGTFHPDLDDLHGGFVTGTFDTRPLDSELDPDGGEGAVCELLVETVGVECEECGGDNPGAFCITVTVTDLVNAADPALVIEPLDCADIIDLWEIGDQCEDEAAAFDPGADGTYAACPGWTAP